MRQPGQSVSQSVFVFPNDYNFFEIFFFLVRYRLRGVVRHHGTRLLFRIFLFSFECFVFVFVETFFFFSATAGHYTSTVNYIYFHR